MAYSKYHEDWEDYPSEATPITAAALEHIETGIATVATEADDLDTRVTDLEGAPAPVLDHGALTGLLDDDHPQYALDTRVDATDAALAAEIVARAAGEWSTRPSMFQSIQAAGRGPPASADVVIQRTLKNAPPKSQERSRSSEHWSGPSTQRRPRLTRRITEAMLTARELGSVR